MPRDHARQLVQNAGATGGVHDDADPLVLHGVLPV